MVIRILLSSGAYKRKECTTPSHHEPSNIKCAAVRDDDDVELLTCQMSDVSYVYHTVIVS